VTLPKRTLSKSKLSTYLRTQCDRHLYLSLFNYNPTNLQAANLPIPLKTRPSVQLVTQSGREFEIEQFDNLVRAIPNNVIYNPNYAPYNLFQALTNPTIPAFILQPELEPEDFRDFALTNFGLTKAEISNIPQISGLRPDVLFLHEATASEYEVLPNGNRKRLSDNETRTGISVIDLKNVTEANASYAAEVCLYTFFLANWLATAGQALQNQYFVSDHSYLWKHVEMPHFQRALTSQNSVLPEKRIGALLEDLNDGLIEYLVFIPSVRKFFKEDIPRVVQRGDSTGWDSVEYHISPKCGGCDWLGNKEWLFGADKDYFNANPMHYCLPAAEGSGHLSQISGLSKGATHILANDGHNKLIDIVGIAAEHPTLKKHSLLKRDKSQIGERAKAIHTGNITLDNNVKVAGIAKSINAEYDIIVNFDAGAGFLTGIAVRGIFFPPFGQSFIMEDQTSATFITFKEEAFVVNKDNIHAEWAVLQNFISKFSSQAAKIQKIFTDNGWGAVSTQICFWESRQYEELCNAFSRHLINVLQLTDRDALALAWIFPAEELMEREEEKAPGIVFIRDIVDTVTRLPLKFSHTLLGVASSYFYSGMPPRNVDTYYREPLGNAIPRERIFEIWKCTTGVVRMYGKPESLSDAVSKYGNVLKSHAWALASITAKLREDFRHNLIGKAPALNLSIPSGARGVAYDSKLWVQWNKVEVATSETEGKMDFVTKHERLESSYKAVVLGSMLNAFGGNRYEFEVSEESTEAKLEEGKGYYVLGFVNDPGFPLKTARALGVGLNPPDIDYQHLNNPLHKVINVFIEAFNRVDKTIILRIEPSWSRMEPLFDELLNLDLLPIATEPIYILDGLPYNDAKTTTEILQAVGNPTCATVAPEVLTAMGSLRRSVTKGRDVVTPISRVLWEADKLSSIKVRNDDQSLAVANFAKTINANNLNESQVEAVKNCAQNRLSIIWGPPGTGKTDTLASLLTSLTLDDNNDSITKKILITGPNYRAVEELTERLLTYVNKFENAECDLYLLYSKTREPKQLKETNEKLNANSITFSDSRITELRASLLIKDRVTIVATTAHTVGNINKLLNGGDNVSPLQSIFDFIVIDESSQVPVTLALRPLALLKENGQLVIAGDHLQMPPISSLDPPKDAEYMVGSIQSYLIKRFNIRQEQLLINYRSNQQLVDYAKSLGYPNGLVAFDKDKSLYVVDSIENAVINLPYHLPKTNAYEYLLIPDRKVTAFIHDDISSSQANEFEAKMVAGLAFCLVNSMSKDLDSQFVNQSGIKFSENDFFTHGIGIVTPHKAQKALVIRELRQLFPNADPKIIFEAVDTVERFQGGERQTIIVSFGVGDLDIIEGEEAFLLQMERTNVAISRAKAKSILLLPKSLAYYLPTEEKTIKTSIALKSYIEEFCSHRQSADVELNGVVKSGEVRWH
jgi:hypothetical protein